MRSLIAHTATLAALLLPLTAVADIKLGAYVIPGVLEANKSGDYDKILQKVGEAGGVPVNYAVLPAARLEDEFKAGSLDCIFPLDARFWDGSEKLNTEPVNIAKIYIFSKAGEGPYTSLDALKGKTVGIRNGISYGPKTKTNAVKLEAVSDDDKNVQKLNAGRIAAFLSFVPDMWFWAKEKKQALPNHDPKQPFDTHKDAFLCRDNKATQDFVKGFNAGVVKLRASGELKALLGESYVP